MTIKTVSTWLKTAYIPEDLLEARTALGLPSFITDKLRQWEEEGKRPKERHPGDSIVVTEDHYIVTHAWLDLEAAQEWVDLGHNNPRIPELVSRVLVVEPD